MRSGAKKVQSQLLVNLADRDRADALAITVQETRAEIYRRALAIGLTHLENTYLGQMKTLLDPPAARWGMDRTEMAGRLAEAGLAFHDVKDRRRFPA